MPTTFDFADRENIPALKRLWRSVFGDPRRYIDYYFEELFSVIRIAVARDGRGRPVSMLSMLPVSLRRDGERFDGHYIYAAGTRRRCEGQGIMSGLLNFACEEAARQGDRFSCLIPASEPLFGFYEKRGYQTCFYRELVRYPKEERQQSSASLAVDRPGGETFAQLRTAFVETLPACIEQSPVLYPYIREELLESGMEVLHIRIGESSGYVVCYGVDDLLVIKETSFTRRELERVLPYLEERLRCHGAVAAFPPFGDGEGRQGKRVPYGMLRPLDPELSAELTGKTAYMGLLMD